MKRLLNYTIILALSLVVFGCGGYTTEEIETETKEFVLTSISETLDLRHK